METEYINLLQLNIKMQEQQVGLSLPAQIEEVIQKRKIQKGILDDFFLS